MTTSTTSTAPSRWERLRDSFLWYSFKRDRTAQLCLAVFICLVIAAFSAPLLAPTDPYDLAQIDILASELPPFWIDGADEMYTLVGVIFVVTNTIVDLIYGFVNPTVKLTGKPA